MSRSSNTNTGSNVKGYSLIEDVPGGPFVLLYKLICLLFSIYDTYLVLKITGRPLSVEKVDSNRRSSMSRTIRLFRCPVATSIQDWLLSPVESSCLVPIIGDNWALDTRTMWRNRVALNVNIQLSVKHIYITHLAYIFVCIKFKR